MKLSIVAGATSQSINVFIQNSSSTTGDGLSGLVYNTSGLAAYYSFSGANAAAVAITLATLATTGTAWSAGGFIQIDATHMKGWYRLDLPDAVLASGNGRSVSIHLYGVSGMAPCPIEIELTGWNNQDVGVPAVLADGVVHGGSTATLVMASMSVTNPSGDAVVFAGGATGTGFRSAGGASGDGVRLVGGSVVGYPVRFSHTSTPDGSDVLGQLGPNVLDLVHLVAPTGPATEFVEAMTQLYYREFPPSPGGETFKSTSDHTIRTRDASGNVITTQPYTDDNAGNESLGPPS